MSLTERQTSADCRDCFYVRGELSHYSKRHSSCLESLCGDFLYIAVLVIGAVRTTTSSAAMSVLRALVMAGSTSERRRVHIGEAPVLRRRGCAAHSVRHIPEASRRVPSIAKRHRDVPSTKERCRHISSSVGKI